jgi:hypothetical protein
MFYVISDTLLKVVNMFYAIANIVESGFKHHQTNKQANKQATWRYLLSSNVFLWDISWYKQVTMHAFFWSSTLGLLYIVLFHLSKKPYADIALKRHTFSWQPLFYPSTAIFSNIQTDNHCVTHILSSIAIKPKTKWLEFSARVRAILDSIDGRIKPKVLTTDWNATYKYLCGDKALIE